MRELKDAELDQVSGGAVKKAGPNNFIFQGPDTGGGPADKKVKTGR